MGSASLSTDEALHSPLMKKMRRRDRSLTTWEWERLNRGEESRGAEQVKASGEKTDAQTPNSHRSHF